MARPLRIEYPDAFYHVSNYGIEGQRVFPSRKYFEAFLDALAETCARLNVEVHAYCLLQDQYHLLLKTPEGNLSRFMRQIDGLYTQHYQRMKKTAGSLFRGRYKAVLIQPDRYLLPVSRYIHLGVKRGDPAKYEWSSYPAYINQIKPPEWLVREEVLSRLDAPRNRRYVRYAEYVAEGVDEELARFYGRKNLGSVLGDEKFRKQVAKKRDASRQRGISRGANAKWRPGCREIVSAVAGEFKVSEDSIYKAARGPGSKNVPRWVSMYLCQELSGVTLQTIARLFGLKRYGTVSTTVGKLKKEMQTEPKLARSVEKLQKKLSQKKA